MLIALDNETVLNIKTVKFMCINSTPKTEEVEDGYWFLIGPKKYKKVEKPYFTLQIDYISDINGDVCMFTAKSENRDGLKKMAKTFIEQVRLYDPAAINQAFEDAFLKG